MSDGLIAPDGQIWVCCACGKTANHQHGDNVKSFDQPAWGWDSSCVMNSKLFDKDKLVYKNGRVVEVKD